MTNSHRENLHHVNLTHLQICVEKVLAIHVFRAAHEIIADCAISKIAPIDRPLKIRAASSRIRPVI